MDHRGRVAVVHEDKRSTRPHATRARSARRAGEVARHERCGAGRAVFRVMANEVLLELARTAPTREEQLLGIKGMPRSLAQRASGEILGAIANGLAVGEESLPKYPKSLRWQKDPDFDRRATLLKGARDVAAKRLQLDPGVLCSRERIEAVARRNPGTMDELAEVSEIRKWQAKELGSDFLRALQP